MVRICFLLALMFTLPVYAGLIGDTVTVTWVWPEVGSIVGSTDAVVGAGIEITCPGGGAVCSGYVGGLAATFDIADMSILHTHTGEPGFYTGPYSFNGFEYSSLDVGGAGITGFLLTTDIAGLDASRVSFGADFIRIDMQSLDIIAGQYYQLDLLSGPGRVPEPSTMLSLGAGLLLLGGLLRRRARS